MTKVKNKYDAAYLISFGLDPKITIRDLLEITKESKHWSFNLLRIKLLSYKRTYPDCLDKHYLDYCQEVANRRGKKLTKRKYEYWKTKTSEERSRIMKPSHISHKKYWENLTDIEKKNIIENLQKESRKYLETRSEEEKRRLGKIISDARKKYFKNMSEEEKKILAEKASRRVKAAWKKLSKGEQDRRIQEFLKNANKYRETITHDIYHQRWVRMHPDKKNRIRNALTEYGRELWSNMTVEKFEKMMLLQAITSNRKEHFPKKYSCEIEMANLLQLYKIDYTYSVYNIEKGDGFNETFPSNHITGSKFVSPYHQWDFRIHTKEKDIFLDVDGSVHYYNNEALVTNPSTKKKFRVWDSVKFNDAQRPYQTDGLDAYVVECPKDKLSLDSNVKNIMTMEFMTLQDLLYILKGYNIEKEELKLAKEAKKYGKI